MPLPQETERYTYADYCTWDSSERWELIDGVPYAMTPAPSQQHQRVSGEIFAQLHNFLKGKPYDVFHAPADVRLAADGEDDTVVQPDLFVVSDKSKLDGQCCNGAPDLVIEVLSPSTSKKDCYIKLERYRRAGVREYWIVDLDNKGIMVHTLKEGQYRIKAYCEKALVPVSVLAGLEIMLTDFFPEEEALL